MESVLRLVRDPELDEAGPSIAIDASGCCWSKRRATNEKSEGKRKVRKRVVGLRVVADEERFDGS